MNHPCADLGYATFNALLRIAYRCVAKGQLILGTRQLRILDPFHFQPGRRAMRRLRTRPGSGLTRTFLREAANVS